MKYTRSILFRTNIPVTRNITPKELNILDVDVDVDVVEVLIRNLLTNSLLEYISLKAIACPVTGGGIGPKNRIFFLVILQLIIFRS